MVLWKEQRQLPGSQHASEHFVRLDLASGCTRAPPGLEQDIGTPLIDDRHVYWRSSDAAGGAPALPQLGLVRMHLQSQLVERLVSPELAGVLSYDLIAQDGEQLYLRVNGVGPLLAARKPN